MTALVDTLLEDLDDLSEVMADNLTTMGVPSTANEGLTTLANKILDISPVTPVITLTSNKSIISYYDSETATLTATHSQGAGKTVEIYNAVSGAKIGDATDNHDGTYTYTYTSTGNGDISMTAVSGQIESNAVTIEDCTWANTGTSVGSLEIGSNVSCTSNGTYITITTSTSGEKYVYLPVTLTNTDNWEFSVEIAEIGTSQSIALIHNNVSWYSGTSENDTRVYTKFGGNQVYKNISSIKGNILKIKRENRVNTSYWNDEVITTDSVTPYSSFKVGFFTNNGRVQHVKNIKLKAL